MQYSYGVPFSTRQIKGHLLSSNLWTYSDSIVVIVLQLEVTLNLPAVSLLFEKPIVHLFRRPI